MAFNCTKCGGCCMHIGEVIAALSVIADEQLTLPHQLLKHFPYQTTETGACEHYDPQIGCRIYETRPDICSVDRMFEIYYKTFMTRQQFEIMQVASCELLINIEHLHPSLIPTIT